MTMSVLYASRSATKLPRTLSALCDIRWKSPAIPTTSRSVVSYCPPNSAEAVSSIRSSIDASSEEYKDNASQMRELLTKLEDLTSKIKEGGSLAARQKHVDRGKMLPRDRIAALIDPGTSFLELSPLAGHELYPEASVPAGGILTGIGAISGVTCMLVVNDSTVKGGTYYPITVKKHLRAQAIAQQNKLPCVYLVDSGGANLPHQADVFPDRDHFGRIFYNQARMSAQGIPQISVVMGPCTAGGAYVPAMSDESIIVQNQGHIFLAGPPLVKAATGEVVTAEELGGGNMHTSTSGVTDYLAVSDAHALVLARRCIANLNYRSPPTPPSYSPPLYAEKELDSLAPVNLRRPLAMHEIIARIVDSSAFSEFKPLFGTTLICGFSTIHGHPVGILASAGPLFSASALKGAHFISLCTARSIPLVFLQNISGFMVGKEAEREGIAKNGAKLVMAVACAEVPKFTIVVGGSFGAGNYGMCGRAFGGRFLWSWPGARTAVMGSEQLGGVMDSMGKGTGNQGLRERIDRESEAVFGSARLWDDGIIPPSHTRRVLGLGLSAALGGKNKPVDSKFGIFRM